MVKWGRGSNRRSGAIWWFVLTLCGALMIVGTKNFRLTKAYETLQSYNVLIERTAGSSRLAYLEMKGANERLTSKVNDLQTKYGGGGAGGGGGVPVKDEVPAVVRQLKKANGAILEKVQPMKDELISLSRTLLPLLFGEGPYILTVVVELPGSKGKEENIVFKLEPDLMPYTTLFFLRQVDAGLWAGTSVIRAASHVIQADPRPNMAAFKQAGMTSVAFQEYNPEFPHKKHTIGLAGRPGGPDFYVSMIDNTKNHGPGGQGNYDLPAEADPAFGTVIAGHDVLERIHKLPTKEGNFKMLIEFVTIKDITLNK
ncbi:hypothetical protein TrST_g4545 [Triparma strigata]|uniref:PPIase cyclophilin-type domain-containing protein n=1 Tax=Triparma strigata TaxID=1606541 RepID=A0A9W7AUW2_9STRA|nr:hypothetical protein TrST_g4545 [Triparma strigata]